MAAPNGTRQSPSQPSHATIALVSADSTVSPPTTRPDVSVTSDARTRSFDHFER